MKIEDMKRDIVWAHSYNLPPPPQKADPINYV